jgi:hypothetical protein
MFAKDVVKALISLLAVSLHPTQNANNNLKLTAQYPSKLFSNFLIFDESVGNNI